MTITPEQFNKIALKEDLENFYTKKEMDKHFDKMYDIQDKIMTKLDNIERAFLSNQVAHDRFETRITKIEKNINLNSTIH